MKTNIRPTWRNVVLWAALSAACAGSHGASNTRPTAPEPTETTAPNTSPDGNTSAAAPGTTGPSSSGERVDFEVSDAAPTDALRTLAGMAAINVFADPDIDDAGPVTMTARSTPWQDVLAKLAADHQLRVEKLDVRGVDRTSFWITKQSSPPAPVKTFTGERLSAKFDDTPVREAAKTIAAVAKMTIIVEPDVEASITLHLRLPWDLALYHLAQKYSLRIVRTDHELRITRR